jgi:hypothetical protein
MVNEIIIYDSPDKYPHYYPQILVLLHDELFRVNHKLEKMQSFKVSSGSTTFDFMIPIPSLEKSLSEQPES